MCLLFEEYESFIKAIFSAHALILNALVIVLTRLLIIPHCLPIIFSAQGKPCEDSLYYSSKQVTREGTELV